MGHLTQGAVVFEEFVPELCTMSREGSGPWKGSDHGTKPGSSGTPGTLSRSLNLPRPRLSMQNEANNAYLSEL